MIDVYRSHAQAGERAASAAPAVRYSGRGSVQDCIPTLEHGNDRVGVLLNGAHGAPYKTLGG